MIQSVSIEDGNSLSLSLHVVKRSRSWRSYSAGAEQEAMREIRTKREGKEGRRQKREKKKKKKSKTNKSSSWCKNGENEIGKKKERKKPERHHTKLFWKKKKKKLFLSIWLSSFLQEKKKKKKGPSVLCRSSSTERTPIFISFLLCTPPQIYIAPDFSDVLRRVYSTSRAIIDPLLSLSLQRVSGATWNCDLVGYQKSLRMKRDAEGERKKEREKKNEVVEMKKSPSTSNKSTNPVGKPKSKEKKVLLCKFFIFLRFFPPTVKNQKVANVSPPKKNHQTIFNSSRTVERIRRSNILSPSHSPILRSCPTSGH